MVELGVAAMDEDEMAAEVRELTVKEWLEERRKEYEKFLASDDFEVEVLRFRKRGYFAGELGNLTPLGMSNLLKLSIVIFSSLENYPVIPILPVNLMDGSPPLFVSFNSAGPGHYDNVIFVSSEPTPAETVSRNEPSAKEKKMYLVLVERTEKNQAKLKTFATTFQGVTQAGVNTCKVTPVVVKIAAGANDVAIPTACVQKSILPKEPQGNEESLALSTSQQNSSVNF